MATGTHWRPHLASSREEALRLGHSRYVSSRPCKHGHTGMRYLSGGCVTCKHIREARRYK